MTETETETETETQTRTEAETEKTDDGTGNETDTGDGRDARYYVERGVLGILLVIGFVASLRFYLSATAAIDYWVTDAYVDVFQAAFNLIVLLLVGIGITRQIRKIS
ncbi:hypothetical protein ACEU6E_04070 [Halorutilales archaeon Cl-col2-1]